jgi:hypothetical protein
VVRGESDGGTQKLREEIQKQNETLMSATYAYTFAKEKYGVVSPGGK